jgi:UDP-glucose 4-epimerase
MDSKNQHILVTGGTGYIGSHTVIQLLLKGDKVTIIDNLSNSNHKVLERIKLIVGEKLFQNLNFKKLNLCDEQKLDKFLSNQPKFDSCIHFAGLKAVGESVKLPLLYYHNNITGTIFLLKLLIKYQCYNFIFSSSATVYGNSHPPLKEDSQVGIGITNPYGSTKYMIEQIIKDLVKSEPKFKAVILRYFNPVGAHPSGQIGENPNGIPNNLMPYVQQVVIGKREKLTIFGNDYNTKDGTGVRDYIHVEDLANGHLAAINKLNNENKGYFVYNLGTGNGYSVLDMVKQMEKASNRKINYVIGNRRQGDLSTVICNPDKANNELKWSAKKGLEEMCVDSWNWQSNNPNGFE